MNSKLMKGAYCMLKMNVCQPVILNLLNQQLNDEELLTNYYFVSNITYLK